MPDVRMYKGRPTIFVDGTPDALPTYSPISWRRAPFEANTPGFFPHRMGAYFLSVPRLKTPVRWGESPFWRGDEIGPVAEAEMEPPMDEQAAFILAGDPDARFWVRNGPMDPPSWRDLHRDELMVTEDGETLEVPSMASDLFWRECGRATASVIRYCEGRPWADRIIGYWYGLRTEGTHEPLFAHHLFDHSAGMLARWRRWLTARYGSDAALQAAWGDPEASLETVMVPRDRLRGPVPTVERLLYWQTGPDNAPLRDYLLLQRDLFHAAFRTITGATAAVGAELDVERVYVYDGFKQIMQGWSNFGFFDPSFDWPLAPAEVMAGSGSIEVAGLFDCAGFDGVVTPHDYQARGVGGVCEPEGIVDSLVLRGKYFLTELDVRTWHGDGEKGAYGTARDLQEFEAIAWRDLATGITRGFNGYWMDLVGDWFNDPGIHDVIERVTQVHRASLEWEHETVPGIAVILDDQAMLETNGNGAVANETVMWELKMGLSHCGVPYRIYLLEDLTLDNFPEHRVIYFPNLHRVDAARLALLRERVMRDGNVVLWGPGSGISDGATLSPAHAERLTGMRFDWLQVNHPRRVHITRFDHPITAALPADMIVGGPLAYGPVLMPTDGVVLGNAWTKQARNAAGLAVKAFGRGARGEASEVGEGNGAEEGEKSARGPGDWASVYLGAAPVPSALWQGLARYAGAHIYCEAGDVLMADRSVVALHSIRSGPKTLHLPGAMDVHDAVSGELLARSARAIHFDMAAPATRVFHLTTPA